MFCIIFRMFIVLFMKNLGKLIFCILVFFWKNEVDDIVIFEWYINYYVSIMF